MTHRGFSPPTPIRRLADYSHAPASLALSPATVGLYDGDDDLVSAFICYYLDDGPAVFLSGCYPSPLLHPPGHWRGRKSRTTVVYKYDATFVQYDLIIVVLWL